MAHARASVHVLDATMFWSATGGGVRRYLRVKHAWICGQVGWRHSIAAPVVDSPDMALLPAWPLPGSGGYRLPVRRRRLARRLEELQPDIIEAGDPYRLAWAVLDAAQHLQIPAVAYCHSNLEALGAGPTPPRGERVISALSEAPRGERSAAARRRARAYDWDGLLPSLPGQYQRLLQQVAPLASQAERSFGVTADPAR